ncbi:threonine synthase [Gordoniibacillus kamchatkensis]|uniref:threonine synthase n=1 Tax=Gordoniibacillus kamchatkensis TaxID=1590651 RepID=UPI000AA368DE|nr:threonine synthase [Paenibacillus sp. VKM B-2647]
MSLRGVYSKREEINPTGSFKARGFSAAVTLLHERGVRKVAVNSNGNAAAALAAYAARAGMEAYVFVPKDCPGLIAMESVHYGAHTYLVDGYIQDAGRVVEDGAAEQGWVHVGTLREPGRAEGKKTMGLEVAEQLEWTLPDVILYPTGGGSGIIGLWRAFEQLRQLGWVQGELPRLIAVQESGCQPIVDLMRAYGSDNERPALADAAATAAPTGLRVPAPPDGHLIASILRRTGGDAISVTQEDIRGAAKELAAAGLTASPEGAAVWAGLLQLHDSGYFRGNETVVLFNTSHAVKYWPWSMPEPIPVVRSYADFKAVHPQAKGG